jgi:U3 small nucleolar RNA-associated protein 22
MIDDDDNDNDDSDEDDEESKDGDEIEDDDEGDYIEGEDAEMQSGSDIEGDEAEDEQDEFMAAAELEASSESQHPSGIKNKSLYKAPTNEEIQGLQESADLFKSNIFKLQIEELLKEVQVDYKKTQPLEAALRKLKDIFDNTPAQSELSVSEHAISYGCWLGKKWAYLTFDTFLLSSTLKARDHQG